MSGSQLPQVMISMTGQSCLKHSAPGIAARRQRPKPVFLVLNRTVRDTSLKSLVTLVERVKATIKTHSKTRQKTLLNCVSSHKKKIDLLVDTNLLKNIMHRNILTKFQNNYIFYRYNRLPNTAIWPTETKGSFRWASA